MMQNLLLGLILSSLLLLGCNESSPKYEEDISIVSEPDISAYQQLLPTEVPLELPAVEIDSSLERRSGNTYAWVAEEATFSHFLQTYSALKLVYQNVWEAATHAMFGITFNNMNNEQLRRVKSTWPIVIWLDKQYPT